MGVLVGDEGAFEPRPGGFTFCDPLKVQHPTKRLEIRMPDVHCAPRATFKREIRVAIVPQAGGASVALLAATTPRSSMLAAPRAARDPLGASPVPWYHADGDLGSRAHEKPPAGPGGRDRNLNRHNGRIRRSRRLWRGTGTALGLGRPVVPVDWRSVVLSAQGEPRTLILSQVGALARELPCLVTG